MAISLISWWPVNGAAGAEYEQIEVELVWDVQHHCGYIYSTELELFISKKMGSDVA